MRNKWSLIIVDAVNVSHVFMEENISERFVGTHEASKIGQLAIGAYRVLIAAVNFAQVTV